MSSLPTFLDKCFLVATSLVDRQAMQKELKRLLQHHKESGTIDTHDWSSEPVKPTPPTPSHTHHYTPIPSPSTTPISTLKVKPTPPEPRIKGSIQRLKLKKQKKQLQQASQKRYTKAFTPTCDSLCPLPEQQLRTSENMLHPLEITPQGMVPIKEFKRSAAGSDVSAANVRTPKALHATVTRLCEMLYQNLIDKRVTILDSYYFFKDRIRAVHQDISCQDFESNVAFFIPLLEVCVKVLLYLDYLLIEYPREKYDFSMNIEQINRLLSSLLSLYKCDFDHAFSKNFSKFKCLTLLLSLNTSRFYTHANQISLAGGDVIERISEWNRDTQSFDHVEQLTLGLFFLFLFKKLDTIF
ncbi:hypothetical protein GEMRC1_000483 [Eukaryota sp. GEM-RC1]